MPASQKAAFDHHYDHGEKHHLRIVKRHTLAQMLKDRGFVAGDDLLQASEIQKANQSSLERILITYGWIKPEALLNAQAAYLDTVIIDPVASPPTLLLVDRLGLEFCLSHNVLPWRSSNNITWVAVSEFGCPPELYSILTEIFGPINLVLCLEKDIQKVILQHRGASLVRRAEACVPETESCRPQSNLTVAMIFIALIAVGLLVLAPSVTLMLLLIAVFLGLFLQTALKLTCFVTAINMSRSRSQDQLNPNQLCSASLPMISIMVPLYKESEIADRLVMRLTKIKYPCELTEVILLLESDDNVTQTAIDKTELPDWFRVITVPEGSIKTKPRALNYGLNFCKGDIVGVWDAEDKPLPEQLHHVAAHFRSAGQKTGCVQGVLDYYNPRTNWLSRCFTIEYASWFRVLLPAMAQLGMVIPLGGTTCFFRREALKDVHAWDAWNVTEDADLGIRLARYGWHTEIVPTCTYEEANCRFVPWIRQRSRWLKGYAMTWRVHMRSPLRLWRDLGPLRFIGFQIQFLTLIGQIFFAPAVWGFWFLSFGISYPPADKIFDAFGPLSIAALCLLLIGSELVNIAIGILATSAERHQHLRKWVVTTYFYFPLGFFALCKALYELVIRPFYWDKTAHGIFQETPMKEKESAPLVEIPLIGAIGDQKGKRFPS